MVTGGGTTRSDDDGGGAMRLASRWLVGGGTDSLGGGTTVGSGGRSSVTSEGTWVCATVAAGVEEASLAVSTAQPPTVTASEAAAISILMPGRFEPGRLVERDVDMLCVVIPIIS